LSKEDLLIEIKNLPAGQAGKKPELLITSGAGDIDVLVEPIKKILEG
jgi:hypothetical protein